MSSFNEKLTDFFTGIFSGMGCLTMILLVLAILFVALPVIMFVGAMVTGGFVWMVWNLALVPIFGLTSITYWWQAWAFGLGINVAVMTVQGIVKAFGKGLRGE